MEVIIGLHPACCAWPRRSHPPAKPTFRFPSPIKTYDPFSSLNRFFFVGLFAPSANCKLCLRSGMRGKTLRRSAFPVSEGERLCVT